jgi:hypothetical protein
MDKSSLRQIDRALAAAGRALKIRGRITSTRVQAELYRSSRTSDSIHGRGAVAKRKAEHYNRWLPIFEFWKLVESAEWIRSDASQCSPSCRERISNIESICKELRAFAADPVRAALRKHVEHQKRFGIRTAATAEAATLLASMKKAA